jgi:uncharacterized protein YyaL (SSP411 family)
MPNRLANESSPYLLQHKDNPVDWYPWGEEALQRARDEEKPIFLSIGYAACHWCHVMEHESFEDPDTAALMNQHFINIKVDREERPDLDHIYMDAVVSMTGQGGWPMSVFLTPEGKPFFGGTYFPPTPRYNMPSFRDVLQSIVRTWENDRGRAEDVGEKLTEQLKRGASALRGDGQLDPANLDQAALKLAQSYDWQHGGWGQAPKFPQPMSLEFLLKRASRGDSLAMDMVNDALKAMSKGGMYDVVGGGFARYSVDEQWLVPHFEKMLYDNAQLARVYLLGYLLTGDTHYRRVSERTVDFVLRELTHPEGGFYSSLDADSEGEEGLFYIWTIDEIREALEDRNLVELVTAAYGLTEGGNFEGQNVLQREVDDQTLGERFGLTPQGIQDRLAEAHEKLLSARASRPRPATDDKVLVSWNGLMLTAIAEAARFLGRTDYLAAARRNARFLTDNLLLQGRLYRSWREGVARHNGYLEDYGSLILGLISLYQSDHDSTWFQTAVGLLNGMIEHFEDPQGGFFDTPDDHEALLVRPKDVQDNATPSGNALAAEALLKLSAYTGNGEWRDRAERNLATIQSALKRYPTGFGRWLSALDFAIHPGHEVAILGSPGAPGRQALVDTLWSRYRPNMVAAISDQPPDEGAPPLLKDRPLLEGKPTAYVCRDFYCQRPVTEPQALAGQLL